MISASTCARSGLLSAMSTRRGVSGAVTAVSNGRAGAHDTPGGAVTKNSRQTREVRGSGVEPPTKPSGAPLAFSPQQWSTLCSHLESTLDQERAATARALHDEMGGLLVAAKMDLGHVQRGLNGADGEVRQWLLRAQHSLDTVVAAERRLVEELQPGLLMHIGLFAALRWYVQHLNAARGGGFEAELPSAEPALRAAERIALYRAAQDALEVSSDTLVRVTAAVNAQGLSLTIAPLRIAAAGGPHEDTRLLAIRHRVAVAGAAIALQESAQGTSLTIRLRATP
jgi:signal transduction histidine kinase